MGFRFYERPESRKYTENPRAFTMEFAAEGTTSETYVAVYALANTALMYHGLWRQDVQINPQGHMLWYVTVPYAPQEPPTPYEFKWTFDTTGGTAKITHAVEHIQSYAPAGKTAPDHKGAIGVNQSGEVEGCEKVVPAPKWTETHQLPTSVVPFSYSDTLEALTGTVNNAAFRGKAAGTVRFDGAQGSGSNKDPDIVEVTYHFVRGINVTGLTFGDITGVAKGAWQYLWVQYEQKEDSTANKNASRPIAVYVERIYEATNFALLGIGTT